MNKGKSKAVFAEVALINAPNSRFNAAKHKNNMVRWFSERSTNIKEIRLANPVFTNALAIMKLAIFNIMTGSPSIANAGRIFIMPVMITATITMSDVR